MIISTREVILTVRYFRVGLVADIRTLDSGQGLVWWDGERMLFAGEKVYYRSFWIRDAVDCIARKERSLILLGDICVRFYLKQARKCIWREGSLVVCGSRELACCGEFYKFL